MYLVTRPSENCKVYQMKNIENTRNTDSCLV